MARHIIEKTPATRAEIEQVGAALTACPGMQYRSTDTNQIWVGAQDGSLIGPFLTGTALIVEGTYPDDDAAAADGVSIDAYYAVTAQNIYGLPDGTVKKRTV